ncbi:MAG TPA: lactate racemase domain-containing protein [Gaiellaceae bacterium]
MSETYRAVIPYESMDPLAIGATDDESKKHRDTLELEIPSANLVAAIYPEEPPPVADVADAARQALASPVDGPAFAEILAGRASVAVIVDNQFRPTPSSKLLPAVFDAIEAAGVADVRVCCANGKVFPMSESDLEQKLGRANLERMERNGWPFRQNDPQNPDAYTFVGVSSGGTPVWLLNEVASADVTITIGQAQANHWGAGGGGKLILPGVVSDETVESNHCAFVTSPQTHYGAYVGPMRSDIDEVASMCGLDCTMNVILDTHGRVADVIFGSHPEAHREAIRRFNAIYAYDSFVPEHGQADIAICGVFAPTDHLFFHTGWGCMSADLVVRDGGTIIYTSPSPGVSTAIGDFPGLALMDLMKPYMPATPENYQRVLRDIHARAIQMWAGCIWVPIYEVMTRKRLTLVTLAENLEMAADIGLEATTSLDEAFAAAMERHGADAKVAVLPYARYQLPRNAVRMEPADERIFAHAGL